MGWKNLKHYLEVNNNLFKAAYIDNLISQFQLLNLINQYSETKMNYIQHTGHIAKEYSEFLNLEKILPTIQSAP